MHELALAQDIVSLIEAEASRSAFSRVRVLRLELGAFGCVDEAALRFCFGSVARGTPAQDATIEVIHVPGTARCLDCEENVTITERLSPCPQCGGGRLQITGGQDLRLRELEVD